MDSQVLDHEKFEGLKELAEISTKIAAGTAALAQLKQDEDAYLTEREVKLTNRLKQSLVDSANLIKAIGENHDALVGYKNEVGGFLESVLSLIQRVMDVRTLVDQAATDVEKLLEEHDKAVASFKEHTRSVSLALQNERSELSNWRDRLGNEQRKFDDRVAMFERTLTRNKLK